jgi:dipeptidyl aminopeptidase/acylaminoacyl peptidase
MTPLPPEQLLSVARAFRPVPTPSGSLYLASDLTGFSQTYRLDGPDRFPVRLAPGQDRLLPVDDTPLGLLVRTDVGGNETWQLALLQPDRGLRPVTSDRRAIHRDVSLSPDGASVGLAWNPGGQADWVIGVLDLRTGQIRNRVDRGGWWSWLGWSPDGRTAAVAQVLHDRTLHHRAHLLGPDGELRPILGDALLVEDVAWAGDRLLALTDLDREHVGLVELDPDAPDGPGAVRRRLIDEGHDVLAAVPDPSGRRVAAIVDEGAFDSLRLLDLASGTDLGAPWRSALPPGVVYSDNSSTTADHVRWSPDGSTLLIAWESSTSPAEIYELPVPGRAGVEATRWTRASGDRLPGLVAPVSVSYRSFDGTSVPALHFRVDGTPRPTVVYFHGGPASQARAAFQPIIAMWNAAGYDVLAPNVRGSTGYGRRYYEMDDRELRWDSVRDGCEAGRWLRAQGCATRLVAMGGSYGGFMTLAVLVEDPELWDAGVDVVGIADWHSFFRNTSGWRRAHRATEYGDPAGPDGAFLADFSPLRRADRIRAPLLVIHGANDVRVPVSEAVQIHEAAPDSELLVFDDEGHGILKHGNRVRAYGRALAFVRERTGASPR